MMDFVVESDIGSIVADIKADTDACLMILSMQILKDCNYFCKQDQGDLISSSITKSDLEHGDLIWDTVYARMQYYLGATSHDVNPNATKMWCEKAFSVYGKDWDALLQKLMETDDTTRAGIKSQLQSELEKMKKENKGD